MISPSNAGSRRSSRTCGRACQGGCRDCSCRGNERRRGTRCRAALAEADGGRNPGNRTLFFSIAHYRVERALRLSPCMLYSKRTGRWRFLFEFAACALLSLATAHYRLWCRRGFQVTGSTVPDSGFRCPIWRCGTLQTCFSAVMRPFHSPWSMGRMDEEMAFTSQSARLRCHSGRSVFCVLSRLATDSGSPSFVPGPHGSLEEPLFMSRGRDADVRVQGRYGQRQDVSRSFASAPWLKPLTQGQDGIGSALQAEARTCCAGHL